MTRLSYCCALVLSAFAARAAEPAPADVTVLDTSGFWRTCLVRGSDLVREKSGALVHVHELSPARRVKTKVGGRYRYHTVLNKVETPVRVPKPPPRDWRKPEFDDGDWGRFRGPFGGRTRRNRVRLRAGAVVLWLRGKFRATDPDRVAGLRLALDYRGGVAVHLNGRELTRAHLPDGELTAETPADEYPMEAYVTPDGKRLSRLRHRDKFADRYEKRDRALQVDVPAAMLRKGINVLALELHRAPAPQVMYTGDRTDKPSAYVWWPRLAATRVRLAAAQADGLVPNVARPDELQVWNHPTPWRVSAADYGDPNEPIRPLRLVAPRNGAGSGQVVVSAGRAFRGLKVTANDLAGPGRIPADAVQVRFGLPDGPRRAGAPTFDGLELFPPDEVPVATHDDGRRTGRFGAVQPIWVTVRVPKSAEPGDYTGQVTVAAGGEKPVDVPVELRVPDFVLPEPRDFTLFMGVIQSPHTVAMHYNVPFGSERHWRLVEKSFELIGQLGGDTLYLPLVRRTHLGNEHSMLRWIDRGGGTYEHDFRLIDRYLDLAVKHLGRIPAVIAYCWEPPGSTGHFGHYKQKDREILISVLDPETGMLTKAKGPAWNAPECAAFWKPVMAGLRTRLKKRGLDGSLMLGMAGDYKPTKAAVEALKTAAPDALWASHQHSYTSRLHGQPVGYVASVWGLWPPKYAWRNPLRVTRFPRNDVRVGTALAVYRIYAERWLNARGRHKKWTPGGYRGGVGRIGGDFWPVLEGGRRPRSIAGRYPETGWGQLTLNYSIPYVICPGRDGAVASVRFELMRENVQEAEARALIEDAAVLPDVRAQVGEQLADRCLALLDDRTRTYSRVYSRGGPMWHASCGRRRRTEALYALAAEVRKRLDRN
ncbi:MAG: DUF6067 family protein [Planctomycetota bacterium]